MAEANEIIWRGCDPAISTAIQRVMENWKGYSSDLNAKRSIASLMKKFVDPAVDNFRKNLPNHAQENFLNGPHSKYSDFIKKYGYDEARKILRIFERNFVEINYSISTFSELLSTLSTIYSFTWECELNRAQNSPIRDKGGHEGGLNRSLDQIYCTICGNPTVFASSVASTDHPRGEDDQIRPSYKFCSEHTPILNGKCNAAHKKGMRKSDAITRELYRLLNHANLPSNMPFLGRNILTEWYLSQYVEKYNLRDKDLPIIKRHAYEIVRDGMSDRKKEIQTLKKFDYDHSMIADHFGITRQSISKSLASTPVKFRI